MTFIYFILFFVVLIEGNKDEAFSLVRIYSNQAEFIQPIRKLPLEFIDEDWNRIRSDSITLFGHDVNITSQTITEKKKSMNGMKIYIRSPISLDQKTTKLIEAILIDEDTHLVQIQDPSIITEHPLYFNVPHDQIYYLEKPSKIKHYVNFTYISSDSNVFVSYLQSNLNWRTQYRLNLYPNNNVLIAMANIGNVGKSSITISQAYLFAGDINLPNQKHTFHQSFKRTEFGSGFGMTFSASLRDEESPLTVEQGTELAGLYIFPINKPFTIHSKTNYLIPMFHSEVSVERYASISQVFLAKSATRRAQRSYRLKSDRFLPEGICIIRENDYLVGEISLPNLAAKHQYEFSIGEDADIIYKENITLISSKTYNETESIVESSDDKRIVTRQRFVYNVDVQFKNFKNRSVKIEYEQKGFHSYQQITIKQPHQYELIRDGSSIKMNTTLEANTTERFSFILTLVS